MHRNRLNPDDEAKFALLEPDGVSPLKARRAQMMQDEASRKKGLIVLAFTVPLALFMMRPSPGLNSTAWVAAAGSTGMVSNMAAGAGARSSSSSSSTVSTRLAGAMADLGDTVIIDKRVATKTQTDALESAPTVRGDVMSSVTDDVPGEVVVTRRVVGAEDLSSPPPPPTPSTEAAGFLSWLLQRRRAGKGSDGQSPEEAQRLIKELHAKVGDGYKFASGEMAQELARIERLERREPDGAQKQRDAAATARLEAEVRTRAQQMNDPVSEKLAAVEALMSKHGAQHPDLVPRLRELERLLSRPDTAHAHQGERVDEVARGMDAKAEALSSAEAAEALKTATALEASLQGEERADDEQEALASADAAVKRQKKAMLDRERMRMIRRIRHQRAGSAATPDVGDAADESEDVIVVRRPRRGEVKRSGDV